VANPSQLVEQLTGLHAKTISESGAPRGKRWLIFIDPITGPARAAVLLLKAALHRGLRTIVYTQSRKLTELIALWAGNQAGQFAPKISAYRAGFLPEERREIEARLSKGDLLAVISTSALELGIDIGDLDLCLLVGYPGSVVSTWQRGGRVGRSGQDSALILIAGEDALDQYFIRNPSDFLHRKPEAAVINPYNPDIMAKHLVCAAAELTLKAHEPLLQAENSTAVVGTLEKQGKLLRSAKGDEFYTMRKAPHRHVDLRGTGRTFKIISSRTSQAKGEIDDLRAFRETHPGAIYLHKGATYLVDTLDLNTRTIKVSNVDVDYYTRVRSDKTVDILDVSREKIIGNTSVYEGRIKVTDHVTEYETWRIQAKTLITRVPLDLPPQIFETEGIWFKIPSAIQHQVESRLQDFIGGIHAMEHAAIGIFPLLVMADRNDLGGLAMPYHPQLASAVVFIYDGVQGGAGLTRQAFEQAEDLLSFTKRIIEDCPCESGCPSCVHSPKCGSGNRPMDKAAAISILNGLNQTHLQSGTPETTPIIPIFPQKPMFSDSVKKPISVAKKDRYGKHRHYGVLDIETRRSAAEVGGWHRADRMGVSCAILYDSEDKIYFEYLADGLEMLIQHLQQLDLVIGFNIKKFDFQVLRGYSDYDFNCLNCLDILEDVHEYLGFRLSLAHLTHVTLGQEKTADGLQALRWWQQGRIREIIDYCKQDVKITRDLYLFGQEHGYLLFENKGKNIARIPVKWDAF
jgi:DEAD/DEAH box helicase domain-containing protein